MSQVTEYAAEASIAVITLNNPPVNALSVGKRVVEGIIDGVKRAEADPEVKATVLIGAGRCFSGGADISEFGKTPPADLPNLRDLCTYLDTAQKPIVCAVHGITMGGGVETALACHYRIAAQDAQLGLPEVKLGLLPGSGGTQRLPRLVGQFPSAGAGIPLPCGNPRFLRAESPRETLHLIRRSRKNQTATTRYQPAPGRART